MDLPNQTVLDYLGRVAGGVIVAALAASVISVVIPSLDSLMTVAVERSLAKAAQSLAGLCMLAMLVGLGIALLAYIPALCLHAMAEANGWRHPITYILMGGALGPVLTSLTSLPGSAEQGDRVIGWFLAASGTLAGWIFWCIVVRTLRKAALSPRSDA